jgi:hypothetical protein
MCGRMVHEDQAIVEKIDNVEYLFDSTDCISLFKRFRRAYGEGFLEKFASS